MATIVASKKPKKPRRGSKLMSPKVDRRRIPPREAAVLIDSFIPSSDARSSPRLEEEDQLEVEPSPRETPPVLTNQQVDVFTQLGHVNVKQLVSLKNVVNMKVKLDLLLSNLKRNSVKVKPEIHNVWTLSNSFKKFVHNKE